MEFVLGTLIILLALVSIFLFRKMKKKEEKYEFLIDQTKDEVAATVDAIEEEKNNVMVEKERTIQGIESNYKSIVYKLEKQIDDLEKYAPNRGEVITHNALMRIKEKFVQDSKISSQDMLIMGNVFIPNDNDGETTDARQIDHIVLLPTGIFIIETKYWRGKVLHGITKNQAEKFSYLLDVIFPESNAEEENTLVLVNDITKDESGNSTNEVKALTYGNPAKQVRQTAAILRDKLQVKYKVNYVCPVLYYAYKTDDTNNVVNYSTAKKPIVIKDEASLSSFLEEQLSKEVMYSSEDLYKIKNIISVLYDLPNY